MDRNYPDIPTQGRHRGSADEEISSEVRASQPPDPTKAKGRPVAYQLLHHPEEGRRRIRTHAPDRVPEPDRGYTEMGRFTSWEELRGELARNRDEPLRAVVFENTQTGEVDVRRETDLHDNWTADGRFDAVTIFDDPDQADAYADERRNGPGRT